MVLPTIPVSDRDPTRILHDDLWSRGLRGLEFFSSEVITGMVLEAGSRMKFEASRDRARVNAKIRTWAFEAVVASKKAAHAFLKGLETFNTPALLGEDRRDGETLFDLNASVHLRADEWDRIWQPDKAELPRLSSLSRVSGRSTSHLRWCSGPCSRAAGQEKRD